MADPKLTIELVPETSWYSNLRSNIHCTEWDRIRRACYIKANYKCECCGGTGPKWPVECHEIWDYNDETLKQTLMGVISLCPACHEVKHIGLATTRGRRDAATKHLAKVNDWTYIRSVDYVQDSFQIWAERSQCEWDLDIKMVQELLK